MFGFNIDSDLELFKDQGDDSIPTITCHQDHSIQLNTQCDMSRFVGRNKYNTIRVYLQGSGKLISIKDMGCFYIDGTNIAYYISTSTFTEAAICIVLGTHILGNILLPKHYLLHAATIAKNGRAVALMGSAGMGKSTMALNLLTSYGYALLSEDMSVLCIDNNDIVAKTGFPYMKAWDDTLRYLEYRGVVLDKIANVYKAEKKQILDVHSLMWPEQSAKLNGIIILKRSLNSDDLPRKLTKMESYISLMDNHYIDYSCTIAERRQQSMLIKNILSTDLPVYTFSYPNGYERLDEATSALDKFITNI